MKKIILLALAWPLISYPIYAQKEKKEKTKNDSHEIIIIKSGDDEKKYTIETKNGEVFINGKPSSEYKEGDVNVVKQKFRSDRNFLYTPEGGNFRVFTGAQNGFFGNQGFLGVTTEKAGDGVKITDVSKGSAADKAGLKEGDIITKIGDKKISDPDDLMEVISGYKPKADVAISYKRDGKSADVKATLKDRNFPNTYLFNNKLAGTAPLEFTRPKISGIPGESFAYSWGFGRARLGVRIEDTENETGAKITDVDDESTAAKAGLKENDIITEVNGKKVKDVNEVRKELVELKDKTSYTIKANRNGSEMNFEIKIPKKLNKADL